LRRARLLLSLGCLAPNRLHNSLFAQAAAFATGRLLRWPALLRLKASHKTILIRQN